MKKTGKTLTRTLAVVCAGAMLLGIVNVNYEQNGSSGIASASAETVQQLNDGLIDTHTADYFDSDKVFQLTDTVTADTEISVILSLDSETMLEKYDALDTDMSYSEYSATPAAMKAQNEVVREENNLRKKLNRSGVSYSMGETYDTLVNGFEITIKAGDFDKLASAVPEATLIVGEEYGECATEVVTNDVDVYETGIFDSSRSNYKGDGVVVAVLDTGLDYTHTAFDVGNFEHSTLAYSKDGEGATNSVEAHISSLTAATTTADLTASDVYISEKVPYQYDYADKDTDVFPINSEHGTHVSGVIAGNDSEITGVAPSAQIMMMKVFSDTSSGAKTSWILAALEDCVKLGVDVINMSLGSSCGFSREVDKDNMNLIYDQVEAEGISMICAAGNDYTATYGSDKNGSLALTSNPDNGTVSSSSSYDATMSVASVSGVATNYMLYGDEIIYFNEASDSTATTRSFFDDIIGRYESQYGVTVSDDQVLEIPYEIIPGLGRNSDYSKDDYTGEIVLVKRGTTTFEEKIRIAMSKNALGIIIYNNVSGDISMSIGSNADAAACSISQDDGEMLVAAGGGTLKISKSQEAGPFMSDFSSWGPTSDLKIKPEITAHGGDIYSCVPGQSYDRLSGTSMATPNMAGATAIIRQYVKANDGNKFGASLEATDVSSIVYKLEMSTADIIYNKNGLPYSVRKQGAGLVNLYSAQESDAYISTLDENGNETDKTKFELGDDAERTGVYKMSFILNNISNAAVEYKVDALVQTEGVSTTYTSHGDTTVTSDGEILSGAKIEVTSVSGGSEDGNIVRVGAGGSAVVTVEITLSEADKNYMDGAFENGMYVEGFITLEQLSGTDSDSHVNLNAPFLAFYGDWCEAPIFDEEYYDTNVDEVNAGLDDADKLMADGFATRVVGGLYDDYIAYMGTYFFIQDPSAIQVAASKDHIAMSNQSSSSAYNINNLAYVYAGLLRNVKEMDISITEDATGKTIYTDTVYNQRKSYGTGSIYASAVDMDHFSASENNLKNNTQYTVTLSAYIDYAYDDEGYLDKMHQDEVNKRNTFSFPLYIDYEAPVLTDVEFRQEYDSVTKKTSLYADLSIYDNHYAMAVQVGNVTKYVGDENYLFSLNTFGNYLTPISSSFNSTTLVSVDMTDYINDLKDSAGYDIGEDGKYTIAEHTNSFLAVIYDYAMNSSIFEVRLPDEIVAMYFDGSGVETVAEDGMDKSYVTLALNETLDLTQILNVYPSTSWVQTFDYKSSAGEKVTVVNQTILALEYTGDEPVVITVAANGPNGTKIYADLYVIVQGDRGYTLPVVNSFSLKSYCVNKAFYSMSSDEREIGYTGYTYAFGDSPSLTMFPSESVTVEYDLQTYFPYDTYVSYSVANSRIATVDEDGTIVAVEEGSTTVTATVYYNDPVRGAVSQRSARISITVKNPFTTSSIYLMSYKGNGGEVVIPDDRGITTIYQYAFSNYEYVSKDLSAGDVIDEEDPYATKPWYIGEDTITKVFIPEGVKEIDSYAFAGLTALEEVVLPSTLTRIGYAAFRDCTALTTISFSGDNNVKFINDQAFYNCTNLSDFDFENVVAIGKYSFYGCNLSTIELERYCQSLGEAAFANNTNLRYVDIYASSIKLGEYAFYGCSKLMMIEVNASVIPSYAFAYCSNLTFVELGADVSVINACAFYGTSSSLAVSISALNSNLATDSTGTLIYSSDYSVLQIATPGVSTESTGVTLDGRTRTISNGAFAGTGVKKVAGESVTKVEDYAFYCCYSLSSIDFGTLTYIGDYAFYYTKVSSLPDLASGADIGDYAFALTAVGELEIKNTGTVIGDYAFYLCGSLTQVTIADKCGIGAYAFFGCESLESVAVGNECDIGDYAFAESIAPDFYTWYETYYEVYYDIYYAFYKEMGYSDSYAANYADAEARNVYITSYGNVYEGYTKQIVNPEGISVDLGALLGNVLFVNDGLEEKFFKYNLAKANSSVLTSVSIGNGTTIGTGAFQNCVKLKTLNLAEGEENDAGIVIGDYAFYNCVSLADVDFGKVNEIGAYAFSVTDETIDIMYPVLGDTQYTGNLSYAYEMAYIDGTLTQTGYMYTSHSGSLTGCLDLSGVTKLGEGAFARNTGITGVVLNDDIGQIPAYAFYMCSNLTYVGRVEPVEEDGPVADLSDINCLGEYSFARTGIVTLVLQDDMIVGDGAFYMCEDLVSAENLSDVISIGAYAFAYTYLGSGDNHTIDLSGVGYIGDYAFAYITTETKPVNGEKESKKIDSTNGGDANEDSAGVENEGSGDVSGYENWTLAVDFLGDNGLGGGALVEIGENPFLGTDVDFTAYKDVVFGGEVVETEATDTYMISGTAFVSQGVLYTVVGTEDWTGYMLVMCPVGLENTTYTIENLTVRISAHAFDGNTNLRIITLSSELTSIGDKAFYGCENLSVVVFTSYYAPALEEEYDEDYYGLIANYPAEYYMSGYYPSYGYGYYYEGLGVVDYRMWSVGPNNYFYGATFVDYIGKIERKLTMVVPVNGQQYDSFTLSQYFDTVIYGSTAATSDTLTVIAMIEDLPESRYITLADSEGVYAALAAYNALSPDQQALVTNYSKLTACIGTLSWLEYDGGSGTDDTGAESGKSSSSFMKDNMWGLIIALVILVAFVALLVYTILMKRRQPVTAEVQGMGKGSDEATIDNGVLSDSTVEGAAGSDSGSEEVSSVESSADVSDGADDGKNV